jgi:hypothetical protein
MMSITFWKNSACLGLLICLLAACAPKPQVLPRYGADVGTPPRSILVIPVVNTSTEVEAADAFLDTLAIPLAERGYYVFPTNMVKRTMEDDGMGDSDMVHAADTQRLAAIFGADAVLYAKITDWNSRYIVLAASTSVAIQYDLRLGSTGQTIWRQNTNFTHTVGPQNSGGGIIGAIVAGAVAAAIERAAPSYLPLASLANAQAMLSNQSKLPVGPYYRAPVQ